MIAIYPLAPLPPSTVNFVACLKKDFMGLVYSNLRKSSQDAIREQIDPKELKGIAVKVQADIVDCTIGR
jgi:hypothetical protein